mmetsp:Transcript_20580/g.41199  ORF Transcript_20580/g.41199 Transcript_20580/m.41199 type:complete len:171 (-) Transcript_20580:203-715(-)|eukprot:CAMPEP_0194324282 /NCGR_PEP_ID=MMETSP0171-20130528/27196_1 /TAXON_ID=218684 /ORGANISM="Corethron pennatum, Strain L29A3" /LENGTH=170 /DNA_ID=CAMNT_0039083143 /DNA_START=47 /DNA_END=559 /DNA_ORIENTATION=+
MKFISTIVAALLVNIHPQTTEALAPSHINTQVGRRVAFTRVATTIAAGVAAGGSLLVASPHPAVAAALPKGAAAFEGTFTDPINHPGGKRTITLLEGYKIGDYHLAEVAGGGGIGEPRNYILPAAVIGDRTIVIDFSPKGGPKDFVGVLDTNGDIKFLRDGNRWPRQFSE